MKCETVKTTKVISFVLYSDNKGYPDPKTPRKNTQPVGETHYI